MPGRHAVDICFWGTQAGATLSTTVGKILRVATNAQRTVRPLTPLTAPEGSLRQTVVAGSAHRRIARPPETASDRHTCTGQTFATATTRLNQAQRVRGIARELLPFVRDYPHLRYACAIPMHTYRVHWVCSQGAACGHQLLSRLQHVPRSGHSGEQVHAIASRPHGL